MSKISIVCSGLAVLCLASGTAMASQINLYDQPADNAKVTGQIDTEKGFVPIFTQKDGKWVKVGDPDNGNTGWVKSTELSRSAGSSGGFSYSQSMVSKGNGAPSMVVRFGKPKMLTDKQMEEFWQQNQKQQEAIQRDVQNMMQSFFGPDSGWMGYPMVLPVMVVPVQQGVLYSAPAPASSGSPDKKP